MSKRILIGNDINVSWRVNLYDPSEERLVPLSSVSGVGVQLIVGTHSIDLTPENSSLNIVDNLITFTFYGRDQVYPGAYILKLYDKTSATITYYACNAFVIVNRDGEDIGTDPEIVDIESTVNLNRTLVTKGEKGDKGDPGVDGAAGSIGSILTIGENGNWWIDGVDTGIPATGAQGESGKFKSIVFKRSNAQPTTPTGGTYSDPIPHDPDTNERWSDGIPGGEGLIWASSATFLGNDHHTAWSIPQIMKDTTDIDIEFALMQNDDEKPAIPNDNNRHKEAFPYGYEGQIWFDPEFDEYKASGVSRDFTKMYWMAQRQKSGGNTGNWTILRIQGEKGDAGQARFKSTMFVRMNSTPSRPADSDGSWSEPTPRVRAGNDSTGSVVYWSDGIPSGTNTIWATSRLFTQDGKAPQDASWTEPSIMSDSETFDVEFAYSQEDDAKPEYPSANNRHKEASPYGYTGQVWFDPTLDFYEASGVPRDFSPMWWRAEREIVNGEPQPWTVIRIKGEKGERGDGQSSYKSTMFVRMNDTPTRPDSSMGSFADPSPSNCQAGRNSQNIMQYWSDGIPDGSNILWATTRIFTNDGSAPQQEEWTEPRQMTDTEGYDVEFAKQQANDATPPEPVDSNRHGSGINQIWFDPTQDTEVDYTKMFWRAEQKVKNGVKQDWVITRIQGERGDKGERSAIAYLYKRSATKPSRPASDSGWPDNVEIEYTFSNGSMRAIDSQTGNQVSSIPSGWVMFGNIPDGTETIWAIAATATAEAADPNDQIPKTEWSEPTELGAGGKDGINCLTITLYKRSNTAPTGITVDTVFSFNDNILTYESTELQPGPQDPDATIEGWRRYVPQGNGAVWQTQATALSSGGSDDVIEEEEWTPPARVGGFDGADGIKSTVVYLYRRSDSILTPEDGPGAQSTYSFEEKRLTTDIGEWKRTVPNSAGALWVVAATASCPASENSDTIEANEWCEPFQWGTNNVNSATIMLFQRAATQPEKPNSIVTYEFTSADVVVGGTHYGPSSTTSFAGGWSRTVPNGSDICWVTQATAVSTTDSDEIPTRQWSTPAKYTKDGEKGDKGDPGNDGRGIGSMIYYYLLSDQNSGVTAPDPGVIGNWIDGSQYSIPTPDEDYPYLWCFTRWTWSDGSTGQSNAYIVRAFNSQAALNYNEIYDGIKSRLDSDFAPGTLTSRVGQLETNAATYVTNDRFSRAESDLEAGIDGAKAAATTSVSKGTLYWETPDFEAYQIKGIGGSPVGGVSPLKIGDVVVIYGKITTTGRITSGYIYSHNGATTYTTTVPDYTPSTSASGSGTQSSPYNVMAARNNVSSSAMKYVKAKIVAKPEVYVDTNNVSNSYITLKLGDIFDYDAFRTSEYEDFDVYESRVINLGYHISSYIDEMSAIRQQSDNILLAVGNGRDVAASISILKDADTDEGKIVLDATHVKVNGDLSASIITARKADIEDIVTEKITAQTVEAKVVKTGNSSVGTEISQGTFNIKQNGVTRAKFGVNDNNDIVLQFLDSTGSNVLYEFGPTGILSYVSAVSPKWNEVKLASVNSNIGTVSLNAWNFPSSFTTYHVFIDGEVTVGGLRRYYIYDQNENLVNHSQYHLKVFSNGGSGTPEGKTLITNGTYLNRIAVNPWQGAQVDTATNANIVQDRNAGYHFFRAYTTTYSSGKSSFNDDFIFRRYNLSQDTAGLYDLPYGQSCLTRALYSNLNS